MPGKCSRAEGCECVGGKSMLKAYCEHWVNQERPTGDLEAWSIANFYQLHPQIRLDCLKRLNRRVPLEVQDHWADQVARGVQIGSDDVRFHFGVGMAVRNELRRALPDSDLPPVRQPSGEMASNWDDYYYGALHCLVAGDVGPPVVNG